MPQSESQTASDSQTQHVPQDWLRRSVESNTSEQSDYEFDAVVVCVGNYHQPNLPNVKGIDDFPGLQMHAHNYRDPAMFAGQVVIVVGASFSGRASVLSGHCSTCRKVAPPSSPYAVWYRCHKCTSTCSVSLPC